MRSLRRALALTSLALLSACVSRPAERPVPPVITPTPTPAPVVPAPVIPPPPANALAAGISLVAGAPALTTNQAGQALAAFRASCPVVTRRQDRSGLTSPADWVSVCRDAATVRPESAAAFFRDRFDWVQVGAGQAFATGYYEPELAGAPFQVPGYAETPIYRVPSDLTRCTHVDGKVGRGRIDEFGQCVLYHPRAEIEDGALAGKGLELAWAADPIELFFLHIQGSGRVLFPDGRVMRIGYAEQNGREYVAIGRLLRERGILPAGGASMQAIVNWMRANPALGRQLMRENPSYIFFRELTGPGPLGAINVPVVARVSVAADPLFVPLGAPVFLMVDRPEANGLWVAQDTGGAIKGPNRFDTFWGAGADATRIAGGMSANGQALVLLPKGAVSRALSQP